MSTANTSFIALNDSPAFLLEKLVNPDPERVQSLFLRIVKLPEKDRQRTLEAECDGDLAIQRRVNALLMANDAPDSFLDFSLNIESRRSQTKESRND